MERTTKSPVAGTSSCNKGCETDLSGALPTTHWPPCPRQRAELPGWWRRSLCVANRNGPCRLGDKQGADPCSSNSSRRSASTSIPSRTPAARRSENIDHVIDDLAPRVNTVAGRGGLDTSKNLQEADMADIIECTDQAAPMSQTACNYRQRKRARHAHELQSAKTNVIPSSDKEPLKLQQIAFVISG